MADAPPSDLERAAVAACLAKREDDGVALLTRAPQRAEDAQNRLAAARASPQTGPFD